MTPQQSPGQKPGAPPAETPGSPTPADDTPGTSDTPASTDSQGTGDIGGSPVWASVDPVADADVPPVLTPAASDADETASVADDELDDDELQGEFVPPPGYAQAPVDGDRNDTLIPVIGTLVALVALAALLLTAFVLPVAKGKQAHLPFGVSGPASIITQVKTLFSQNGSNEWEIKTYSSEASLRKAIHDRNVYGGLSVTSTSGTMLIASAGSVSVAESLSAISNSLGTQVTDVVPVPTKDPRGRALVAAGLPLLLAGLLPALVLIRFYRRKPLAQLGVAIGAAFLTGAAVSALLTFWLGATAGANFWLLTVGISAGLLSVSLLLLGLNAVGGWIGTGIGVAFVLLLSAPLGNLGTAPELITRPWGDIGQFLPTGAASSLIRSAAFFDGHGATIPLAVLGVWALAGLLLMVLSEGLALQEPLGEEPARPAGDVLTA